MIDFEAELGKAVQHFWRIRGKQKSVKAATPEGRCWRTRLGDRWQACRWLHSADRRDCQGCRFANRRNACHRKKAANPAWLLQTLQEWDLVVLSGESLVAVVEVKSQVGSFGNNFDNRVEEALGNATDFWAAYREGIFKPLQKPWLGYLFMLEEREASVRPTKPISLKPYKVDEAFQKRSCAKRYELVCERFVRDRLYDAACFFTSNASMGRKGQYKEPNEELTIRNFAVSLHARAAAFARMGKEIKVLEGKSGTPQPRGRR